MSSETEAECRHRATSSRVQADPNVEEGEGGGLADTRSARKADGSGVRMFWKVWPYQQSTKEIVQYQRAVPPGTTTLPINRDTRPTVDKRGVADRGGLAKRARRTGGEGSLYQTSRNKPPRPDHQKGKEEGREMASMRQRQCGLSDERRVAGSDDHFTWCWDFNRRRCRGDAACLTTVTSFYFIFFIYFF